MQVCISCTTEFKITTVHGKCGYQRLCVHFVHVHAQPCFSLISRCRFDWTDFNSMIMVLPYITDNQNLMSIQLMQFVIFLIWFWHSIGPEGTSWKWGQITFCHYHNSGVVAPNSNLRVIFLFYCRMCSSIPIKLANENNLWITISLWSTWSLKCFLFIVVCGKIKNPGLLRYILSMWYDWWDVNIVVCG